MSVDAASGCGNGPGSIRMTAWPSFFSSIAAVTPLIPAPTTITLDIVGPCHSDPAVAGEEAQVIYSITCQEIARDVSLLLNMTRNMQHAVSTKHLLLVLSRYSQRTFPFKQGRMGVIKAAVERVWCEIAQVFFAKLAQRLTQGLRLSHCRTCECVRVVFKTARPDVNERRNPESYRPRKQRKQQHSRNDICSGKSYPMLETERMIKPLLTRQPGDGAERHNDAGDGNAKQFDYMALFVMANFMRKDGFHFRLCKLRDQCVEQNDFSKTPEPGEEGVGVT